MKNSTYTRTFVQFVALLGLALFSCAESSNSSDDSGGFTNSNAVFLVIDEESIDNGNEPKNFSENDVNDQIATIGLRQPLRFF